MALSLNDFAPGKAGLPCSVATTLAALDGKDREVLQAALDDRSVQHSAIARVLQREGHNPSLQSIGRHRRGECRCGR